MVKLMISVQRRLSVFSQSFARYFSEIVLDGGIQLVHRVVQTSQVFRQFDVVVFDDRQRAAQHGFNHISLVQSLTRSA